jgi:hypothetical protein
MRLTRPLAHTRLGLAVIGLLGTTGLAGWGAGMFAFPSVFRVVTPILINGIAARLGSGSSYDAEDYFIWACLFLLSAFVWGALCLIMFIRRPAEDRQIDAALCRRREHAVRGAPTEPR